MKSELSLDELREISDRSISTVRASFRPEPMPAQWEKELAALKRDTPTQELLYFAKTKHYHWLRYAELYEKQPDDFVLTQERARAIRELLTREPVRVVIAGRVVLVTFRGRKALLALAAHDMARREIDEDLERIAERAAHVERRLAEGRVTRGHARRRVRRLRRMHQKYYTEFMHHTRSILANALTPDGRSATAEDAPPWWEEVTPSDESELLIALFRAGPERLAQLGSPPNSTADKNRRAWVEDFGFWSLYSYFEKEAGLSPAAFIDEDVAQFSAWLRAGTPYFPPPPSDRGSSRDVN